MSDKPILFSAPMVRALLAGTKTQTRRGMFKEDPPNDGRRGIFQKALDMWEWLTRYENCGGTILPQPRYRVGDRLWVRESLRVESTDQGVRYLTYAADGAQMWPLSEWKGERNAVPSIHMWRWASRITLTITDVRVERLQDISEADAIAEGVERLNQHVAFPIYRNYTALPQSGPGALHSARLSYSTLWNSINGPGAWEANPWVAAYTFTVGLHNIDRAIA
jgi:hypothetical protein